MTIANVEQKPRATREAIKMSKLDFSAIATSNFVCDPSLLHTNSQQGEFPFLFEFSVKEKGPEERIPEKATTQQKVESKFIDLNDNLSKALFITSKKTNDKRSPELPII